MECNGFLILFVFFIVFCFLYFNVNGKTKIEDENELQFNNSILISFSISTFILFINTSLPLIIKYKTLIYDHNELLSICLSLLFLFFVFLFSKLFNNNFKQYSKIKKEKESLNKEKLESIIKAIEALKNDIK